MPQRNRIKVLGIPSDIVAGGFLGWGTSRADAGKAEFDPLLRHLRLRLVRLYNITMRGEWRSCPGGIAMRSHLRMIVLPVDVRR